MAPIRRIRRQAAWELAQEGARFLARDPRVRLVFVFGSTADEDVGEVRDVDLAVWTDPQLDLNEILLLRADLVRAVPGPFDLVSLRGAPVLLAREIVDHGKCLYAESEDLETEVVVLARARYWDFKPYLDEQSRLIRERQEERKRRGGSA